MEKIFIGIGGQAQLGEQGEDRLPGPLPGRLDRPVRVEVRIADLHVGNADGRPDESLAVQVEKDFPPFPFMSFLLHVGVSAVLDALQVFRLHAVPR